MNLAMDDVWDAAADDVCHLCAKYEGREPNPTTIAAIEELDRMRLDPNAQTYTTTELWAKLDADVLAHVSG
jgi:uncharacterized protein (UPF0147 family)